MTHLPALVSEPGPAATDVVDPETGISPRQAATTLVHFSNEADTVDTLLADPYAAGMVDAWTQAEHCGNAVQLATTTLRRWHVSQFPSCAKE
ncbi:MAG TPA: hypothetical protein VF595_08595 [Tepidisphaeraceae bacterium]|jgi:hypothetical protein